MKTSTSNPLNGDPNCHRSGRTLRVLLVDDEPNVRSLFSLYLAEGGYSVLEAASAEDAESVWDSNEGAFDLLVSDYSMPGKKGDQLVHDLCAAAPNLRCLIVSGHDPSQFLIHPSNAVRVSSLPKPVTLRRFTEAIETLMRDL